MRKKKLINGCYVIPRSKKSPDIMYAESFMYLNRDNQIGFENHPDKRPDYRYIRIDKIIKSDDESLSKMLDALVHYARDEGYQYLNAEGNWLSDDLDILDILKKHGFSHSKTSCNNDHLFLDIENSKLSH